MKTLRKLLVILVLSTLATICIAMYVNHIGKTTFYQLNIPNDSSSQNGNRITIPTKTETTANELIEEWNQQIGERLNKQQSTNNQSCGELLEARPPDNQTVLNLYRQLVVLRSGNKTKFDILTSREVQQNYSVNDSYAMLVTDLKFYSITKIL